MSKLVYVSGPYGAPTHKEREANTRAAMEAGLRLFAKGYYPVVPHLSHFFDTYAKERGVEIHYEEWMTLDFGLIEACHLFLQLAPSPGADRELEYALARDLPCYFSVDEILHITQNS